MKKIIFSIVAFSLAISSCTRDADVVDVDPSGVSVQFSVGAIAPTRADVNKTAWVDGEKVGVSRYIDGYETGVENVEYAISIDDETGAINLKPSTSEEQKYLRKGSANYVAHYPRASFSTTKPKHCDVDLSDQSNPAAIDFLLTKAVAAEEGDEVAFKFYHQLSCLEIDFEASDDAPSLEDLTVSVGNIFTLGVISIEKGHIAGVSAFSKSAWYDKPDSSATMLTTPEAVDSKYIKAKSSAILAPTTEPITITITVGGKKFTETIEGGLAMGTHYTYTAKIGGDYVKFTQSNIKDWNDLVADDVVGYAKFNNWIDEAAASYAEGDGSSGSPFKIANGFQLAKVAVDAAAGATEGKYYELTSDIDLSLSKAEWTPIGTEAAPFKGVFRGAGKSITGMTVSDKAVNEYAADATSVGLFGATLGTDVVIENFNLSGSVTGSEGNQYAAGVVGLMKGGGLIERCNSSVNVTASNNNGTGGIVGQMNGPGSPNSYGLNLTISFCSNTGTITGGDNTGGLAGQGYSSAGTSNYFNFKNSYNSGDVKGNEFVGGIVGQCGKSNEYYSQIYVLNCFCNSKKIEGTNYVGGIMGSYISKGYDSTLYVESVFISAAEITGKNAAVMVGDANGRKINVKTVYYDEEYYGSLPAVAVNSNGHGFIGFDTKTAKGGFVRKALNNWAYEKTHANHIGYDCAGWGDDANGYPYLDFGIEPTKTENLFGDGSDENPGQIYTEADLAMLNGSDKTFIMMADVVCGSGDRSPIGWFNGKLLGNGKTISGIRMNNSDRDPVAFISYTNGAEFSDLTIKGAEIIGRYDEVATLVGSATNTVFKNCHIVGCIVNMIDDGKSRHAGLVAALTGSDSRVINCSVDSGTSIHNTGENNSNIGGLVGYSQALIVNSSSSAKVYGAENVGGLVGYNAGGKILNCYVTGDTNSDIGGLNVSNYVGGLVGVCDGGKVQGCYVVRPVSNPNSNSGALVGTAKNNPTIDMCYYSVDACSEPIVGGGEFTSEYSDVFNDAYYDALDQKYGVEFGSTDDHRGYKTEIISTAFMEYLMNDAAYELYSDGNTDLCGWTKDNYPVFAYDVKPTKPGELVLTGSGASFDPYWVGSVDDLKKIGTESGWDYNKYYKLTNDITITTSDGFMPIGDSSNRFSGKFYGEGHTVTFQDYEVSTNYVGLFGYIKEGAVVKDVTVAGSIKNTTTDYSHTGGVVGYISAVGTAVTVENCHNRARVESSSYTGSRSGYTVGGVVGFASSSYFVIRGCSNSGEVVTTSNRIYAGGIAGWFKSGSMYDCFNNGSVSGVNFVGGLAGSTEGLSGGGIAYVERCYNAANISGAEYVGGLFGYTSSGTRQVISCFNTGDIKGTVESTGGLVGSGSGVKYYACYNIGNVSGVQDIGGLGGCAQGYYGCYSAGTVTLERDWNEAYSSYAGGIFGGIIAGSASLSNYCFFDKDVFDDRATNGVPAFAYGGSANNVFPNAGVTTAVMKGDDMVSKLNSDEGTAGKWRKDTYNKNNGYPILVDIDYNIND